MVTGGNAEHGMMNMSVGGFADRRTIYIYIIISTYELDDMYLPPVFRTRAGGSETFGLVRVVFEKVFAQDDSVVVLVGEHREYYIYIYVFTYIVYRQQPTSMCSPHSYHMVVLCRCAAPRCTQHALTTVNFKFSGARFVHTTDTQINYFLRAVYGS